MKHNREQMEQYLKHFREQTIRKENDILALQQQLLTFNKSNKKKKKKKVKMNKQKIIK
jgi:hypothetical protein